MTTGITIPLSCSYKKNKSNIMVWWMLLLWLMKKHRAFRIKFLSSVLLLKSCLFAVWRIKSTRMIFELKTHCHFTDQELYLKCKLQTESHSHRSRLSVLQGSSEERVEEPSAWKHEDNRKCFYNEIW